MAIRKIGFLLHDDWKESSLPLDQSVDYGWPIHEIHPNIKHLLYQAGIAHDESMSGLKAVAPVLTSHIDLI